VSTWHLIGIDIGTTSVKAVMIDLSGQRVAEFSARYPTQRPAAGQVEQDPEDWLRLVRAALEQFAHHGSAAALCLTSQVNTHVFTDAALNILHPAIVWQDGRAAQAGATLDRAKTSHISSKALAGFLKMKVRKAGQNAPSEISEKQLRELHIKVRE
jgi:xylulokinase